MAHASIKAQQPADSCKLTVAGIVRDAKTGEGLPFAEILVVDLGTGTAADGEGHYLLQADRQRLPFRPDEGYVKGASTTSDGGEDHYLHEALFRWTGWSLVAPRPGRTIRAVEASDSRVLLVAHDGVGSVIDWANTAQWARMRSTTVLKLLDRAGCLARQHRLAPIFWAIRPRWWLQALWA